MIDDKYFNLSNIDIGETIYVYYAIIKNTQLDKVKLINKLKINGINRYTFIQDGCTKHFNIHDNTITFGVMYIFRNIPHEWMFILDQKRLKIYEYMFNSGCSEIEIYKKFIDYIPSKYRRNYNISIIKNIINEL